MLLDGNPLSFVNLLFIPDILITVPDGSVFENGAFAPGSFSILIAFDLVVGIPTLLFHVGDEVDDTKDNA